MKHVRCQLEPSLYEAGFEFDGRCKFTDVRPAWIDYSRPGLALRCQFDPREARLTAESMDEEMNCKTVADILLNCPRSTSDLLQRVEEYTLAIQDFLRTLPDVGDTPDMGGR